MGFRALAPYDLPSRSKIHSFMSRIHWIFLIWVLPSLLNSSHCCGTGTSVVCCLCLLWCIQVIVTRTRTDVHAMRSQNILTKATPYYHYKCCNSNHTLTTKHYMYDRRCGSPHGRDIIVVRSSHKHRVVRFRAVEIIHDNRQN